MMKKWCRNFLHKRVPGVKYERMYDVSIGFLFELIIGSGLSDKPEEKTSLANTTNIVRVLVFYTELMSPKNGEKFLF